MILVAGPYRSGTNDDPELIARNVRAMTDVALRLFHDGHLPVLGEWLALPLIGLAGDTFAARVSASILAAAGLADLVTTSLADYHALALRYASDRRLLAELKMRVAACRTSPLFDSRRFVRDLEEAYAVVVARSRDGLVPDHIAVS